MKRRANFVAARTGLVASTRGMAGSFLPSQGVKTFHNILQFKNHWESEISAWKPHATSGLALFQFLFTHVWVNAQLVSKAADVSAPTAYKLIERFVENGLLREITGAKRDRLFLFDPYLNLFKH